MPLTILVADDDQGTRLSVSDYLELAGYSVITAENGQIALTLVEEYRPHLLVTDIAMPHLDGYKLVEKVRRKPEFRLLPVIFLTARADTQDRIRGYQLGGDVYLPKPFDLDELGAVVRHLLERTQMMQTEWLLRSPPSTATPEPINAPLSQLPDSDVADFELTPREKDVLMLLTEGLSNAQIGSHLHLSPRTVEKYVSSLLRKSETSNRAELVRFAMDHNMV
ncbi:MAG: response regulator transcription factor [Cyanothece sp. SIO1E1]|nr:response regulator transcription factor [Cyanothece sp. SIO1E1]